jgi:hypothetical protein
VCVCVRKRVSECVYVCVVENDAKKGGEARGVVRHCRETKGDGPTLEPR